MAEGQGENARSRKEGIQGHGKVFEDFDGFGHPSAKGGVPFFDSIVPELPLASRKAGRAQTVPDNRNAQDRDAISANAATAMSFTGARLARQVRLFGQKAMKQVSSKFVCVIGCGRNGGFFAAILAYAGFFRFALIDPDTVKPHNLNATVPFFKKDVGRLKVEVVKERIQAIDPMIECGIFALPVEHPDVQKAIDFSDVIVDATDSIPAKKFINARVSENIRAGKDQKLLSLGSGAFVKDGRILQLGAQATLFEKGGACLMCGPLDQSERVNLSRVSFVAVNVLASVLGLQLLLSSIIGHDREAREKYNFVLYDCLSQRVITLNRVPREDCEYCGQK